MKMLTVNADDHPLMERFHKSNDEKRLQPVESSGHLIQRE
jgi:hypothetical protein